MSVILSIKNVARAIHAECRDLKINPENYPVDTGRKLNVHKNYTA